MTTNLFAMLGVDSNCDRRTLDRAYRRRVRTLHPDTNQAPEAAAELAALNEAYSAHRRAMSSANTDAPAAPNPPADPAGFPAAAPAAGPGRVAPQTRPATSPPVSATPAASATVPNPAAGGGPGTRPAAVPAAGRAYRSAHETPTAPAAVSTSRGTAVIRPSLDGTRGCDVEDAAHLNVAALAAGAQHHVSVSCQLVCADCAGTGYDPASPKIVCSVCDGLKLDHRSGSQCRNCAGHGTVSTSNCPTCSGAGSSLGTYEASVVIPAGSTDGHRHRFPRRGLPGRGGQQSGDLFVTVHAVLPDIFIRNAGGVGLVVALHYAELACGTTVRIPTPTGAADLVVPAGTNPGDVLLLEAGGLPHRDGTLGALYVRCDLAPITEAPHELRPGLLALAREQIHGAGVRAVLDAHLPSGSDSTP